MFWIFIAIIWVIAVGVGAWLIFHSYPDPDRIDVKRQPYRVPGLLTVGGARVDLIYRDLDEVLRWTAAAEEGRFEIRREVGYVAGIATYVLAGELALGKVLAGELPRLAFPTRLREAAPAAWFRLAAGALSFADVYAGRQDRVACLANLCQAVLATGQGRLAAAGQWVLNEKRLTERAGLHAIQDRLAQPGPDLGALVSDVRARLELTDGVWAGG